MGTVLQWVPCYNGYCASLSDLKPPGPGIDHPSPPCVLVKEKQELCLHALSVFYGMLNSVMICVLNIKVTSCVILSPITPLCSSKYGLLTSLPSSSVSYINVLQNRWRIMSWSNVLVSNTYRWHLFSTNFYLKLAMTFKQKRAVTLLRNSRICHTGIFGYT
jgi:hypothetical protein